MPRRVHSPSPLRCAALPAALAALLLLAPGSSRAEVDLEGSWFVLVHYRDVATANPDADRWEDKVWTFAKKGSRLQWTEYPIVIFEDGSGRFGRVGGNANARMLHKWEPNQGQLAEIRKGLQVNSRGSKTKTLSGSPAKGWRSSSALRSTSAFTVGYQETWSIDAPDTLPVFTRDDALGKESSLAIQDDSVLSGRTRYRTLTLSDDGNVLSGEYHRDETKTGTFRLMRAGAARGIESDGRTPNQRAQERATEQMRDVARNEAYKGFLRRLGDERVRALRARIGEGELVRIWEKYERRIMADDPKAPAELGDDLRGAWLAAVEKDLAEALRTDPESVLGAGATPGNDALLADVRARLGEGKLAALREKYAARVRAGDEEARAALTGEVRDAYAAALRDELVRQLRQTDAEMRRQADDPTGEAPLF
jgi:hypothetical protein